MTYDKNEDWVIHLQLKLIGCIPILEIFLKFLKVLLNFYKILDEIIAGILVFIEDLSITIKRCKYKNFETF